MSRDDRTRPERARDDRMPDDPTSRAASHALDAGTPAERRALEADAARDRRLAGELREFTETAALLGLAAEPVEPSAGLRESILASLDEVEQVPAPARRRPRPRGRLLFALAAAAAVVIAGSIGAAVALRPAPVPTALEQILAAQDSQRASASIAGGGTATLVWSGSLAESALVVDGLPSAPSGHTYELWYIDASGQPRAAGVFDVSGEGAHTVVLDGAMRASDAVGVTIEPSGGTEAPTTDPIVVIETT